MLTAAVALTELSGETREKRSPTTDRSPGASLKLTTRTVQQEGTTDGSEGDISTTQPISSCEARSGVNTPSTTTFDYPTSPHASSRMSVPTSVPTSPTTSSDAFGFVPGDIFLHSPQAISPSPPPPVHDDVSPEPESHRVEEIPTSQPTSEPKPPEPHGTCTSQAVPDTNNAACAEVPQEHAPHDQHTILPRDDNFSQVNSGAQARRSDGRRSEQGSTDLPAEDPSSNVHGRDSGDAALPPERSVSPDGLSSSASTLPLPQPDGTFASLGRFVHVRNFARAPTYGKLTPTFTQCTAKTGR